MTLQRIGINFGCGLSVTEGWRNYDASPTLLMQRLPLLGWGARQVIKPRFPDLVSYGDIVRGLPESDAAVDYVYCSHILEHLALEDFRISLHEVLRVLKPGGVFRGVLPDLQANIQEYLADSHDEACSRLMETTGLGVKVRLRGLSGLLRAALGNSQHLWLWDFKGLRKELSRAGFIGVRRAVYGDSHFMVFNTVEDSQRWNGCLGFECRKTG